MIFEINISFSNSNLIISTIRKLKASELSKLEFLIEMLQSDLNHNVPGSSSHNFNKGQPLMSIYVKPEFMKYFRFVLELTNKFEDTFSPFSMDGISDFNVLKITKDHFNIDVNDNIVIKNINFEFDSSYFRNIFILNFIAEFFKEQGILVYLIKLDDLYIAKGDKGWIIVNSTAKARVINNTALAFDYSPSGFKSFKFGATDNELKPSPAILVGDSLAELKIIAPQINYVNTKTDMIKFCEENNVKFLL